MNALFVVLTVIVIIAAILLIAVVLLQNGKGDGLASNFVAGNQTFGVRRTADILEKFTWVLVAIILVASIISSFTTGTSKAEMDVTEAIEKSEATEQIEFPTAPVDVTDPSAAPVESSQN